MVNYHQMVECRKNVDGNQALEKHEKLLHAHGIVPPPPLSSLSHSGRCLSTEQQYDELCAVLLLSAKEAGCDAWELDVGASCEQRNTKAMRLWELCNSLMLSALVARISL